MAEFKVVITWTGLIFILLVLGVIFKILPILGLFISLVGLLILLLGGNNNNQEDMVWGGILIFGGLAVIAIGFTAYSTLEEYGVIGFLKFIFNKK
jgi:hypothetical protein